MNLKKISKILSKKPFMRCSVWNCGNPFSNSSIGNFKGDTVLCQSFTFIGSCNPVIYEKANLIFIDSEKDTWNMCPDSLRNSFGRLQKKKNYS